MHLQDAVEAAPCESNPATKSELVLKPRAKDAPPLTRGEATSAYLYRRTQN
jgi:hypothetical protein